MNFDMRTNGSGPQMGRSNAYRNNEHWPMRVRRPPAFDGNANMRKLVAATADVVVTLSLWVSARADDPYAGCTTQQWYTNSEGHRVHSPCKTYRGDRPPGSTAHCRDGSWSFSEHPSASHTCSHHAGKR
jgi:hypothetical protein